jgi:methylglutaconyl-CoA hydratase
MSTVIVEKDGTVARISLNRPDIKNAFNDELLKELEASFRAFASDLAIRAVVLTGKGTAFCAGADLDWMKRVKDYTLEENIADSRLLADALKAIAECPKPVIGRINGTAIGGGTGLVAACDVTVAVDNAVFAFSETRLGLVPAVISPYLARKMGMRNVQEYFLTAQRFSADQARELGLVNYVASAEEIDSVVDGLVQATLKCGPNALTAAKELLRTIEGKSPGEVEKYTVELIARLRQSDEGQEGMNSFLDKRKPSWIKE